MRGVKHGHFDFHISCVGSKSGKRHVDFNAGLSHRYTIEKHDLPDNLTPYVTFP